MSPQPTLPSDISIRSIRKEDYGQWRPLWDGYNAFYERVGPTALAEDITAATWRRFLDPAEPVHAFVADSAGRVVGLVHYLFHPSTTRLHDVCYLQDLFTLPDWRGKGVGRQLIQAVYDAAREKGCSRVYWHTRTGNTVARTLYDKVATHAGTIAYVRELDA